jgi:hypothetical protein
MRVNLRAQRAHLPLPALFVILIPAVATIASDSQNSLT